MVVLGLERLGLLAKDRSIVQVVEKSGWGNYNFVRKTGLGRFCATPSIPWQTP